MDARRALLAGLLIVATGVAAILALHTNPRAQILGGILVDIGVAALVLGGLLRRWQRQLDRADRALVRAAGLLDHVGRKPGRTTTSANSAGRSDRRTVSRAG